MTSDDMNDDMNLAETADDRLLESVFKPVNLDGFASRAELLKLARVFYWLGMYAEDIAQAMRLRADGDIEAARSYEDAANRTYNKLPMWACW